MASLHVSLSAQMRTFVDEQVRSGAYHNHSEYVRALIRRDQRRQAKERVDELLLEGLQSGKAAPLTADDWQQIRQQVRARASERVGVGE